MDLPALIVIDIDGAPDRQILQALHRMLEAQHLAFHILYKELSRMNESLDALNKKADDLAAAFNTEKAKTDVLLQGNADLKQQVTDLQAKIATGGTVTDADLNAVTAKLDSTLQGVNAEVAKLDPAAPPVVLPAPTPAPATPPAAAPAPAADANTPAAPAPAP